uniref:Uncharacterized protein n=1 Tax=Arion vulgaris TaxID=1028688 RepID=A0A0B6XYJ8_9EUPU
MSRNIKSILFMIGAAVFGGASFYLVPPNTTELQHKLSENQGILHKDVMESRRNNQLLMETLQLEAGLVPKKK